MNVWRMGRRGAGVSASAVLVALALVVAACGSSSSRDTTGGSDAGGHGGGGLAPDAGGVVPDASGSGGGGGSSDASACGDLASDPSNCGACGNECGVGGTCDEGTCETPSGGACRNYRGACVNAAACDAEPPCRDGDYPTWPVSGDTRSYVIGALTVIDTRTGLEWQRTMLPPSYIWTDAVTYCEELELDGKTDWRLPTRAELASLVDYTTSSPAIDSSAFPVTPAATFWSATPVVEDEGNHPVWIVEFKYGFVGILPKSFGTKTRCVR